jgi:hypothetical protein
MSEGFADAPVSIGEIKSGKTWRSKDWSPRDLLIQLLRDIDSGAIAPHEMATLVVLWGHSNEKGSVGRYLVSSPSAAECYGVMALAQHKMMFDDRED